MGRAIWFVAGASAGVYAVTRAKRVAEAFTPDGLADRLAGLSVGLHLFGEEVRTGMAEKENDVRNRLSVAFPGSSTELQGRHSALTEPRSDNSATAPVHGRHREVTD